MENTIWEEIDEMLASNGELTQKAANRLILRGMSDLRTGQHTLESRISDNCKKIETLERQNLIGWVKRHPWTTVAFFVFLTILADINLIQRIRLVLEPLFSLP